MTRFYRTIAIAVFCIATVAALPQAAQAQIGLPNVNDTLGRLPTRPVEERLNRELERKKRAAEALAEAAAVEAAGLTDKAVGLVDGMLRGTILATDPNGAAIESDTIAVLVDRETLTAMTADGFDVLAQRDLQSLGLTLATLRNLAGTDLPDSVARLRKAYPDASVDYNHLYRPANDVPAEQSSANATALDDTEIAAGGDRLRVGIIDSAVQVEHRALAGVRVTSRDFAINDGLRPQTHGTAVASLVAKSARDNVDILAASVFFQVEGYGPGATSEGLLAALDWLAGENVDVINMSLAGPGNKLLEQGIAHIGASGPVIVAAVGNNGPSSEPLFPAAYEATIGITAVDRDRRIFRYANRGDYVDFAALGVDVKVADSTTGGWRIESGTSMAAPRVAVIVAQIVKNSAAERAAVSSWLVASAKDLGKRGFDTVFGHGLVSQAPLMISRN
tara:strand:+ start:891 stop:2234 length:1344 start_codon:yes stop_codon:yes gene_type:complete